VRTIFVRLPENEKERSDLADREGGSPPLENYRAGGEGYHPPLFHPQEIEFLWTADDIPIFWTSDEVGGIPPAGAWRGTPPPNHAEQASPSLVVGKYVWKNKKRQ
jgi:hypothetical protein